MREKPLLCLSLFNIVSTGSIAQEVKNDELPNFVIILTDDLGYGDLGCYGNELNKTPNIDKLASEGVRFTDFYAAASLCTPARAALLTGCYPIRVGMARTYKNECVCFPVDETGLNPEEITIAELLKVKHYATGLIGKWHLGDQPVFLPTRQGFDYYYGIPYSNDTGKGRFKWRAGTQLYDQPEIPLMRNEEVIEAPVVQETLTKRYTREAVEFIKRSAGRPFFLYLSHTMPHYPISVSEQFRGTSGNGIFGDVIAELDWSVGEIIETLEEQGLRENTLVIFTSDNGAPYNKGYNTTNAPLSGYKGTVREGGCRVPMIANWQGRIAVGKECNALLSVMDLLPTIAFLAGTELPDDRVIDGKNIFSLLMNTGETESPHAWYAYYGTDQLKAVRTAEWKLYLPLEHNYGMWGKDYGPQAAQLYHLPTDIKEKNNLTAEYPDKLTELKAIAEMIRNWIGDHDKTPLINRPAGFIEKPEPLLLQKE